MYTSFFKCNNNMARLNRKKISIEAYCHNKENIHGYIIFKRERQYGVLKWYYDENHIIPV